MKKGQARIIRIWGAMLLVLVLASCKKEVVPPDIKEEPVFFVQGMFNGESLSYKAGVDSCSVEPFAEILDASILGYLPSYSSSFTYGPDNFTVSLMANEFISSHEKAGEVYLNDVLQADTLDYGIFPFGGNVNINYRHDGKEYAPNLLDIPSGSYFTILHSEEYRAPDSPHKMKKVEVAFKVVLDNINNQADKIRIENGRATLLFNYQD